MTSSLNVDQTGPTQTGPIQTGPTQTGPTWSWFDAGRYARNDKIAASRVLDGNDAAIADYRERGEALGYSPNSYFCPTWYLATYPEIGELVAAGAYLSAFDHYVEEGWRERDPHWLFQASLYQSLYADLTPDAVEPFGGLYGHFLDIGSREGRIGHLLFDSLWYVAQLPEAADAAEQPFGHFLAAMEAATAAGLPEPRGSVFFDPVWYLAMHRDAYRDVAAGRAQNALHHYITIGFAEGRDPHSDFSEVEYTAAYADVESEIESGTFRNAYEHYLRVGVAELRWPSEHVDLLWYAAQPSVDADMKTGRFAHAFAHLLMVGIRDGLPLRPPPPPDFAIAEDDARAAFAAQAQRSLPNFGRNPLQFGFADDADISVIVILRNQFAMTMQALASLRSTFQGRIELILVDNASVDGTSQIGELVLGATIIRLEENIGFLRACNMALGHATASSVLFLNNDVILHAGAVAFALERLAAEPTAGAVGGKIIRTNGLLQEAGCILWRDGAADGWMRGAPPDAPEANYVRDVDFCSGAFLLVRGDLLRALGGFDDVYAPAYYEEADLCLRIQAACYRVVYDPAIVLTHYEYASSRSVRAATSQMVANRSTLRRRHAAALRSRVSDRNRAFEAAAFSSRGRRVLFIEDTAPLRRLGSGYGRAFDVIEAMTRAGWQVTVFPMHTVSTELHQIMSGFPETVEVLWDRDHSALSRFIAERYGYFDVVWVSRAHNLRQFHDALDHSLAGLENATLILDTEAVFSLRGRALAELEGQPFDFSRALSDEFDEAWLCDHVVAVSEAEAEILRAIPLPSVSVIGFRQCPSPSNRPWSERRGLLHVGALTGPTAPNVDALQWYLDAIHPLVEAEIGPEAAVLTVAGNTWPDFDLSWLRNHPGVRFVGPVADLSPLYAASRAFVAPTRFAAGVPTKVLDAASHGLPVVASSLLAGQLGWADGVEILSARYDDVAGFAERVVRLLTDEQEWDAVRRAALRGVEARFSPGAFDAGVAAVLGRAREGKKGLLF